MAEGIVIADYHHCSLFHSLIYLFEKRLGYTLYRPFGLEWRDTGYYNLHNSDFCKGTLTTESRIKELDPDKIDTTCELIGRTITLQEARDRAGEIRFFISSLYEDEACLAKAISDFAPSAILIKQVGNPNEPVRFTKHALCSDLQTFTRLDKSYHKILYHQEFNLNIFKWKPVNSERWPRRIKQYVNFIRSNDKLFAVWKPWLNAFPCGTVQMYEHGLQGKNGEYHELTDMAASMQDADMVMSLKWWDGYGHNIHNAYACGRPVIVRVGDYEGKIADALLTEPKCALKLRGNFEDDKKRILACLEPDIMVKMAWNAYRRFYQVVNFDYEETQIRKWVEEI